MTQGLTWLDMKNLNDLIVNGVTIKPFIIIYYHAQSFGVTQQLVFN